MSTAAAHRFAAALHVSGQWHFQRQRHHTDWTLWPGRLVDEQRRVSSAAKDELGNEQCDQQRANDRGSRVGDVHDRALANRTK